MNDDFQFTHSFTLQRQSECNFRQALRAQSGANCKPHPGVRLYAPVDCCASSIIELNARSRALCRFATDRRANNFAADA
jgi:hypothetical protein